MSIVGEQTYVPEFNINTQKYKFVTLKQYDDLLSYIDILKFKKYYIINNDIYNNLKVINDAGYIIPFKKWIIEMVWSIINL